MRLFVLRVLSFVSIPTASLGWRMGVNQVDPNQLYRMPVTVQPPTEPVKPQLEPLPAPKLPQPIEADVRSEGLIKVEDLGANRGDLTKDAMRMAQVRLAERDARAEQNQAKEAVERNNRTKQAIHQRDSITNRLQLERVEDELREFQLKESQDRFAEDKENEQIWTKQFLEDLAKAIRRARVNERDTANLQRQMVQFRADEKQLDNRRELFAQDKDVINDFRSNFQEDAANERAFLANFREDAANERAYQALFSDDVAELARFWKQYDITLDNLHAYWEDFDAESFQNMRAFLENFAEDVDNLAAIQAGFTAQENAYITSVFGQPAAGDNPIRLHTTDPQISKVEQLPKRTEAPAPPPAQSPQVNTDPAPIEQPATPNVAAVTTPGTSTAHVVPNFSQPAVGGISGIQSVSSPTAGGNKISNAIKNLANDRAQSLKGRKHRRHNPTRRNRPSRTNQQKHEPKIYRTKPMPNPSKAAWHCHLASAIGSAPPSKLKSLKTTNDKTNVVATAKVASPTVTTPTSQTTKQTSRIKTRSQIGTRRPGDVGRTEASPSERVPAHVRRNR